MSHGADGSGSGEEEGAGGIEDLEVVAFRAAVSGEHVLESVLAQGALSGFIAEVECTSEVDARRGVGVAFVKNSGDTAAAEGEKED